MENLSLPKLIIRPQSPNEELDYLWLVLKDMPFFREYDYDVEIPDHPEFKKLAEISPNFNDVDKEYIEKIFIEQCYDKNFYNAGLAAIESEKLHIEKIFPALVEFNKKWGFKIFPQYTIALTGYGSGGMYDPDSGKIVILATKEGQFKRPNPAHTPIHEIIHIGIEENIINRFNLTHKEKERLVDLIVLKKFDDILPDYQIQSFGDSRIDPYITSEALDNLPQIIEKYIKDFPRE